jgi:pimeloyl-ACP methyl ester carboxylesterase
VNGELRQSASTTDLIFDVPTLIETISAGLTLQSGDIIATGTPAGVGIGSTRLGSSTPATLWRSPPPGSAASRTASSDPSAPLASPTGGSPMTTMSNAASGIDHLWIEDAGAGPPVLLVHGLGGTSTYYEPLARRLVHSHRVIRLDLAGHGRSRLAGRPSIGGWTIEATGVLDSLGVDHASVVGHSMGTLVVQQRAAAHPDRIDKLVLLGPVRAQTEAAKVATRERAAKVRAGGMRAVADGIVAAALSPTVAAEHPEVVGFVRALLLGQDPEAYALACEALAAAEGTDPSAVRTEALLITGTDDGVSPPDAIRDLAAAMPNAHAEVLDACGHWAALERRAEVDDLVSRFLQI